MKRDPNVSLPSRYQAVTCRYGPRDWPLVDLIDDWGNRVLKFLYDIEKGKDTNDGSAWNENDLIGCCILRDVIQNCIDAKLSADFRSSTLRAIDELFRSFTYLSERDICEITCQLSEHLDHDDSWWWHRIPRKGALADELAAIIDTDPELTNRFAGSDPTIEEMLALFDGRKPREGPDECPGVPAKS